MKAQSDGLSERGLEGKYKSQDIVLPACGTVYAKELCAADVAVRMNDNLQGQLRAV